MKEIIPKRSWDSKLFDTERVDEKERPIYGTKLQEGLHDIEPDGSFVECDTKFKPYSVGVSTDAVIRNRCGEVRISDTASESKDLVKIKTKSLCGISLKLKGYRTYGPNFDTLKDTYYNTYDGITLRYYPNYKGVNIIIEIANPETALNKYRFSIKEYGCTYEYVKTDDGIHCISSTGEDDIYIKALYATDATGDSTKANVDLIGKVDGLMVIEKSVDPVWFGNAVGPVSIDPDVTITADATGSSPIKDSYLQSGSGADTNYGTNPFIYIGANPQRSLVIDVDLTAYAGVTTVTAEFNIYANASSLTVDMNWYRLLLQFVETQVTWNSYSTGNAWNTPGAKGSGTDREVNPQNDAIYETSGAGYKNFPCKPESVDLDLGGIFSIVIEKTVISSAVNTFQSRENTNLPYFYFEYTTGGGIVFPSIITPRPSLTPLVTPGTIPGGAEDNTWITN